MLKLSSEDKKFIKIVLHGFFTIYLSNFLSYFKLKKYKSHSKYIVISAMYNVEKYLDDFFKSFIKQRLDFTKNILIICVDDGSTDNSAQLILKYQKKYPQNIIYLYKENGGQASARNLGLQYIRKYHHDISWISFTDGDDFLDRNYFYEVDKNIQKYQNEDLCMLSCNIVFYDERYRIYKDNHPLNYKYQSDILLRNKDLDNFIQLSMASVFLNSKFLDDLLLDECLKPNFEDARFINEYLLKNLDKKTVFLKNAKYFYRKRRDANSTLDTKTKAKDYYKVVPRLGYLELLKHAKMPIPAFIQRLVLYDVLWQIKILVLKNLHLGEQKEALMTSLFENFQFIDSENIKHFSVDGYDFFYKKALLNYFKNEDLDENIAFIQEIDDKNGEILLSYYFRYSKDVDTIVLDGKKVILKDFKIRQYDLLNRLFLYEKRVWIKLTDDAKILDIFLNSQRLKLFFNHNFIQNLSPVLKALAIQRAQRSKNSKLWLFADMSLMADDNAEHLYRYVMQNHPQQRIVFALRRDSKDYFRLKDEGFNLVDPRTLYFKYILFRADKVISSHIDKYIFNALGSDTLRTKDFIFLQHGIIKDDLSSYLNQRKIDLLITGTKAEYKSIVDHFNHYKFSTKEVVLTGLARWDSLIRNNVVNTRQILIMPTWREYLSGRVQRYGLRMKSPDFKKSSYFQKWQEFLCSKELKTMAMQYEYRIVFIPHVQVRMYLEDFNLPSYIISSYKRSMQELFCNSSLMITDYSSLAFEMAYLEKPVLYYQFDREEFFLNHSYCLGYFDYEKHGFGPVAQNIQALFEELKIVFENGCKLQGTYRDNAQKTFPFKDGRCCERIYERIKDAK